MNQTDLRLRMGIDTQGKDPRTRYYLAPTKIVKTFGDVKNADVLVGRTKPQATIIPDVTPAVLTGHGDENNGAVLVDFGRELHGTVRVTVGASFRVGTDDYVPFRARVRFGESISEALTPIGGEKNARNDHAVRDCVSTFTFMSMQETGETGFRYLYFEVLDPGVEVRIDALTAVLILEDYPWLGSFVSSDEKLNRIFNTAAYTVALNMQGYFWDGIKRDRIVWLGDMNTEVCTALRMFGDVPTVRRSLDFAVRTTPLPGWMNGIPSYSFWWIVNLAEFYRFTGDAAFIRTHGGYLTALLRQILTMIRPDGTVDISVGREYLDWSTANDKNATYAGIVGLLSYTLGRAEALLALLGEGELSVLLEKARALLRASAPACKTSKVSNALLILGDLVPAKETDTARIAPGGAAGYSTFMGYSILNAKAKADNAEGALADLRTYWGAMLDLGATTFWEDFDLDWVENATGIDEIPTEGKRDIHGDFGKHCYIGLRHSLCHGWSAGPCPFLFDEVLGIRVTEPGMKKIEIRPHLGDLTFASGTIPTPYGILSVSHKKAADGTVETTFTAPKEISVTLSR